MPKQAGISGEPGWDHFPHGADIGVCGFGQTKAVAFEQAALALTAAITEPDGVAPKTRVSVRCEAPDDGLLLVDWLNAIVYEMATRKMLFSRFAVSFQGHELRGEAWGEPVDVARHEPAVEVKGATVTALEVGRRANGNWEARCVIDV